METGKAVHPLSTGQNDTTLVLFVSEKGARSSV